MSSDRPAGPLAAAILAGGRARRFGGANKATLPFGGARIIDHQLALLHDIADPVLIVAPEARPYAGIGCRVVPDAIPGAGPLGAIYTALLASPHERVLVVACDMPFLVRPLLRRLAAPSRADIVMPRGPGGLEPLCAVYARRCAPLIRERIERGALQVSTLPGEASVEEIGPAELDAYDPGRLMFVNVNTPHDYHEALEKSAELQGQGRENGSTDPGTGD